jgi:hypothetical protein
MFGVDPSLRFARLLALLLPKTILQSRQTTMHACYFSTRGLETKHKLNKSHITHALGLFALFSSLCEQKVSAYMPSWALLGMTAVM